MSISSSSIKDNNNNNKLNTTINSQITSQQAQEIRKVCLHKISNPPKIKQILLASTENEFNITKRLNMRYENNDKIPEKIKTITVFKFPIKRETIEKPIRHYEDEDEKPYDTCVHQYSYGLMDNGDYVFIDKYENDSDVGYFGRTFSRGYVSLINHIFPIFQTPYISHVYPFGITPIYYMVLKYLDNKLLNPRSNADFEAIKTIMGKYTDVDVNMIITLDGFRNSCRFWNDITKKHLYYFSLSKKEQRFIEPNYESDEDDEYDRYYGSDSDSD